MTLNSALVEPRVMGSDLEAGLVRINWNELVYQLRLRGKPPAALRAAGIANDTLRKIKRGQPVQNRILEKITIQLGRWPELEFAASLVEKVI